MQVKKDEIAKGSAPSVIGEQKERDGSESNGQRQQVTTGSLNRQEVFLWLCSMGFQGTCWKNIKKGDSPMGQEMGGREL